MQKDDFNIDARISQLRAKSMSERQELEQLVKGALREMQPLNVLGVSFWELLKSPTVRNILIGFTMQLITKLWVKKKSV
jgi:hypothetical protein